MGRVLCYSPQSSTVVSPWAMAVSKGSAYGCYNEFMEGCYFFFGGVVGFQLKSFGGLRAGAGDVRVRQRPSP